MTTRELIRALEFCAPDFPEILDRPVIIYDRDSKEFLAVEFLCHTVVNSTGPEDATDRRVMINLRSK